MVKIQNPIYRRADADRDVDPKLQNLFRRRAIAKNEVDFQLEHMMPLLKASSEEVNNVVFKVSSSIKKVESHDKVFQLAHKGYVERVKECTTGDEEEITTT